MGNSSSSQKKYPPAKSVPEVASKTPGSFIHRGTLRWEVGDFGSLLCLKDVDGLSEQPKLNITSPRLALPTEPGLTFAFILSPKGFHDLEKSLGLRLGVLSMPTERALISFRLLVLNEQGKVLISFDETSFILKAKKAIRYDLPKSVLIKKLPAKNSKVVFVCKITARTSFNEGGNATTTQVQPQNFGTALSSGKDQLLKDLSLLLFNSSTADIRLMVRKSSKNEKEEGKEEFREFPVHSLLLQARAPKLMAELKEAEAATGKEFNSCSTEQGRPMKLTSEVLQVEAMEAMEELLRYLYTGAVSATKALLNSHLLEAARQYEVLGLVSLCEQAKAEQARLDSERNNSNRNTASNSKVQLKLIREF